MQELFQEIENCAKTYGIYTAVGTIRREGGACYNSLRIIDPLGKTLGYYDKKALWGWDLENFGAEATRESLELMVSGLASESVLTSGFRNAFANFTGSRYRSAL